jgi:DNA polymerase IV
MDNKQIKRGRIIFHIDMNSFYASVESALNPNLRGKPLAIAGNVEERRGIIVTCSYEARAKGVRATMPVWQAKRLCPELIVQPPRFTEYRKASSAIFSLFEEYTPIVEQTSIDEGYLNFTNVQLNKSPITLAEEIQNRLKNELILPCSIGIAPNKFLAKMASDMQKPMGITVLRKREIKEKLWPLDIGEMHGVGKKTKEKMNQIGIKTIGDLAAYDLYEIKLKLGHNGVKLHEYANGEDTREVNPNAWSEYKSIGNSTTLPKDITNELEIQHVIASLAASVSNKLRNEKILSQNIQLIIRDENRKTITRSRKLLNPIQTQSEIIDAASFLLAAHWNGKPVRLIGITAMDLVEKEEVVKQLDLFHYEAEVKDEQLIETVEQLRDKFGKDIIRKGVNNKKKDNK